MARYDKERMIHIFEDLCPCGPEMVSLAYYGKLCEYLSGDEKFTLSFDATDTDNDMESYLLDEIIGSAVQYGFPACGATEGVCGFEICTDYFDLGESVLQDIISLVEGVESVKDFKTAFRSQSRNQKFDLVGSSDKEKESRYHLLFDKGGVWDAACQSKPDYFLMSGDYVKSDEKRGLLEFFLEGVFSNMDFEEDGMGLQYLLRLGNPAAAKWSKYLQTDGVAENDRNTSRELFLDLHKQMRNMNRSSSDYLLSSYVPDDALAFFHPYETAEDGVFDMILYMADDASYSGYGLTEMLKHELFQPEMIHAMLKIVNFLEEMEEKYHFLASGKKGVRAA